MSDTVHPSLIVFLTSPDDVKGVRAVYEKTEEVMAFPAPPAYGQEQSSKRKLSDYFFKTTYSHKVGDLIVVPTDTRHGFTVCKVTEVDAEPDLTQNSEVKWVAGQIDVTDYHETCARENAIREKVRKAELRAQRERLAAKMLGADAAGDFGNMSLRLEVDALDGEIDILDAK